MKQETAALLRKHYDKPFYIDGLGNDEYHSLYSISKSKIDLFCDDPASLVWQKTAPVDFDKVSALDFGTYFHTYVLEPDKFKDSFKVLPEFNRRKPAEKQAELDMIEQWKIDGISPVSHEEMKKLEIMKKSVFAHPTANAIFSANGVSERSFFWKDNNSGVDCRCRPDWLVDLSENKLPFATEDSTHLVVDLKTTSDINRIDKTVEEYRYYVQDAFYTRGVESVIEFSKVDFLFVFASTVIDCGRYPVRVVRLSNPAKVDGNLAVDSALFSIAESIENDNWLSVIEIDRPYWATNKEVF